MLRCTAIYQFRLVVFAWSKGRVRPEAVFRPCLSGHLTTEFAGLLGFALKIHSSDIKRIVEPAVTWGIALRRWRFALEPRLPLTRGTGSSVQR